MKHWFVHWLAFKLPLLPAHQSPARQASTTTLALDPTGEARTSNECSTSKIEANYTSESVSSSIIPYLIRCLLARTYGYDTDWTQVSGDGIPPHVSSTI
jgi:hypothetical protein